MRRNCGNSWGTSLTTKIPRESGPKACCRVSKETFPVACKFAVTCAVMRLHYARAVPSVRSFRDTVTGCACATILACASSDILTLEGNDAEFGSASIKGIRGRKVHLNLQPQLSTRPLQLKMAADLTGSRQWSPAGEGQRKPAYIIKCPFEVR